MNDEELQQRLRQLTTSNPSETARERARHRALIAFRQRGSAQSDKFGRQGFQWNWRYAVVLALILGTLPPLFFGHSRNSENLANDRQILRQTEKLFPNQVNAVVEENGKIDLSIADSPVVGSDQPVLLLFKRGHETIRVLSYSGHRVCLMLGKTENCFEILATPTGGVILEGEDQVWLGSEHPKVAGYSLRAQTLASL